MLTRSWGSSSPQQPREMSFVVVQLSVSGPRCCGPPWPSEEARFPCCNCTHFPADSVLSLVPEEKLLPQPSLLPATFAGPPALCRTPQAPGRVLSCPPGRPEAGLRPFSGRLTPSLGPRLQCVPLYCALVLLGSPPFLRQHPVDGPRGGSSVC